MCSLHSPSIAFQLGQLGRILALWTFRCLNLFAFCDFFGGEKGRDVLLIRSIFYTLVMSKYDKYVCKYTACIDHVQIILNVFIVYYDIACAQTTQMAENSIKLISIICMIAI